MPWRNVQSAAGDGIPLDAWLVLIWGPRWTLAASGRCSCGPTVAHRMQRKAEFTRRRDWAAGRRSNYLDIVLQSLLLDVSLANYSFRMNCLSLVRWLLLHRSLLVSLLCHWLVGRADGRASRRYFCLSGAVFFVCGSRQRRREWERGLLWWLSCCWLGRCVDLCTGRRRRSVRWNGIEYEMEWHVGVPTSRNITMKTETFIGQNVINHYMMF